MSAALPPAVLAFSGHDPTGGAGIQADIEVFVRYHCHPVTVITALTQQDTNNVRTIYPQNPADLLEQAHTLLKDIPVEAVKLGLLGHTDTVKAVHSILLSLPDLPLIIDPILAAGGGKNLASEDLIDAIKNLLLPITTVLTPNSHEARRLTGLSDLEDCGLDLLNMGCQYVLITGTHENTYEVNNHLYYQGRLQASYTWPRLPHSYHGSGCTLASAITALIAKGKAISEAISEAQQYTWNALAAGYRPGQGQHVPNRLFPFSDDYAELP